MHCLSPGEKQRITCQVLHEEFEKARLEGKDTISLQKPGGRRRLELPVAGGSTKNDFELNENFFTTVQNRLSMSTNKLLKMKRIFKETTGGKVTPHLEEKLMGKNRTLADFFEAKTMSFLCHSDEEDGTVDDDNAATEGEQEQQQRQ